ncbi:hypothetical protein ACQEXA_28190 [Streptomyces sp. CA-106110]|uniref:hypothetical protein n=1 Tax=Streptomyces sp. CA-106131 TaxID=3240045 RepID=UPI003D8CC138
MAHAVAALAALRDGGRATNVATRRPVRMKLDAGTYDGLSVELPGPDVLAEVWAAPFLSASHNVFSSGAALLTRPAGSDATPSPAPVAAMVAVLRDGLAALPDRSDAGRPYTDLRLFVTVADPANVSGYLVDVVRRVRMAAPKWSPPKADRLPAKAAAERAADSRASRKAREDESSRTWLRSLYDEDAELDIGPGDRVPATELYAHASGGIGSWVEWYEDDPEDWAEEAEAEGLPTRPRIPSTHTFYSAADDVLGPRRRVQGIRTYTIPEEPLNLSETSRAILERAAEMVADELCLQLAAAATKPKVTSRRDNVIPLRRTA